ncbi:MAG: Hpt domain-containing protein [Flavobacteriaceae bacterium]|nr:Hpt domain-containing protein [Flavobacteriaceae bacterium]
MKEIPNLIYITKLSNGQGSFENDLMEIIKRELPKEIASYESHLNNGNFSETAAFVHKINHKIKILGLVNGGKIAEKYRMNLLENSSILKSEFEAVLESMLLFIKRQ